MWLSGGTKARRVLGTGRGRSIAVGLVMRVGGSIRNTGDTVWRRLLGGKELEGGIVAGAGCCGRVGGGSFKLSAQFTLSFLRRVRTCAMRH